jgi:hypothetical protein
VPRPYDSAGVAKKDSSLRARIAEFVRHAPHALAPGKASGQICRCQSWIFRWKTNLVRSKQPVVACLELNHEPNGVLNHVSPIGYSVTLRRSNNDAICAQLQESESTAVA